MEKAAHIAGRGFERAARRGLQALCRDASGPASRGHAAAQLARDAFLETMWPTRCAVCDAPGSLLCESCLHDLPFIDQWQACPRCGAANGRLQCVECNSFSLADAGRGDLPFSACVCAVRFDSASARIVRLYKGGGERRLACVIAAVMAQAVPPEWAREADVLTCVPATKDAVRRRGFDHAQGLARSLAEALGVPFAPLLAHVRSRDQRRLTRVGRLANMRGAFTAAGRIEGADVLLADDVFTTGATLTAATETLLGAGAARVRCVAFARVC